MFVLRYVAIPRNMLKLITHMCYIEVVKWSNYSAVLCSMYQCNCINYCRKVTHVLKHTISGDKLESDMPMAVRDNAWAPYRVINKPG